ncbi:hypothetical protein BKA70DRAFT_1426157 [Coprinopsis sp. MPI-PUGE-AT-0042]|nr:hypothetical protein BKA70DRAFT_1426157 [Coprinopsis sp. MPI-PUGE-AT-0042]
MPDVEFTKIVPNNILPQHKGTYPSPIVIHNISAVMGKCLVDLQGVFSMSIQAWFYDFDHKHSTSFVSTLENLLISNNPVTLARTATALATAFRASSEIVRILKGFPLRSLCNIDSNLSNTSRKSFLT